MLQQLQKNFTKIPSFIFICALMAGTAAVYAGENDNIILRCYTCHGRQGVSGNTDLPNLAGLSEKYLNKQLMDFRDGKRPDHTFGIMPYMVKGLSDEALAGLAANFSQLSPEVVERSEMTDDEVIAFKRGQEIIKKTPAPCRFCHLSNSTEDAPKVPDFPKITGQQIDYLVNQMNSFKEGKRVNPVMNRDFFTKLKPEEIRDIAIFFRYLNAADSPAK